MKRQTKNADVGRLCSLCVWCFAAMYSLQCFVLSPLYFSLYSNVELYDTVLPVIVQYAGIAVELIAISVLYGAMIYGVFKFGQNSVRSSSKFS